MIIFDKYEYSKLIFEKFWQIIIKKTIIFLRKSILNLEQIIVDRYNNL